MSDPQQTEHPSRAETRPHARPEAQQAPGGPPVLRAQGETPAELVAAVAAVLAERGIRVVSGERWSDLLAQVADAAPTEPLLRPVVARVASAAEVARRAGA